MDAKTFPRHLLIFPLPLQGPVNTMLKLAELLCLAGFHVTFLNSEHNHRRLLRCSDAPSRFGRYPGFCFRTISDGLPEDHPRSADRILELGEALDAVTGPLFREMLSRGFDMPLTCIIAEGVLNFALEAAEEIGVPLIYFETVSPCCLWTFFCFPSLIEAGELPFKGDDLNAPITSVPSMEDFLRRRDLPGFCRANNLASRVIPVMITETQQLPRAHGLILNTFEELDKAALSQIRSLCPNIYPIGPVQAQIKVRLPPKMVSASSSSTGFFEEDRSCLAWLDTQLEKSVIYVSFGSLATMTKEQFVEFFHGLVNSGKPFLWVVRENSIWGGDWRCQIPTEVLESAREMGCIVGWAPQEEVLAHAAVGGFLSHGGWNSTLESIAEGVPMICWACQLDQQVTGRFVSEVWKVGIDMKDSCDRVTIETAIRNLMDLRRDEFTKSANRIAESVRISVGEGGSSCNSLNRLIEDIKLMNVSN